MDQHPIGEGFDRIGLVFKVQQEDVDEVEHQHHLGPEVVVMYEQQRPDEHAQVESRKVPRNQLGHLQAVSEATGIVDGGDKNLGDKQDLQHKKETPVC